AKKFSIDAKGALGNVVNNILIENGTEIDFDFIADRYNMAPISQEKIEMTGGFIEYLAKLNDVDKIKKGIDYVMQTRILVPEQYRGFIDGSLKNSFNKLSKVRGKEIENYIKDSFK
ncbi:MAG: hypothetical protein ABIS01_07530, partial [Ferruginibacter sp.]